MPSGEKNVRREKKELWERKKEEWKKRKDGKIYMQKGKNTGRKGALGVNIYISREGEKYNFRGGGGYGFRTDTFVDLSYETSWISTLALCWAAQKNYLVYI
jgi:hypothetical protein